MRQTRQEFKQGETVMRHQSHRTWVAVVVVDPDIPRQEKRWGMHSNITATVHNVRVWEPQTSWWQKGGHDLVAHFRTGAVRNSRKAILTVEEYDCTVGFDLAAERARRAERLRQDAIDSALGVDIISREIREAMGVGAECETDELRAVIRTYVNELTLERTGRGRE
jgi:hypothetical protein